MVKREEKLLLRTRREFLSLMIGLSGRSLWAQSSQPQDRTGIRTLQEWRRARSKTLAAMQLVMGTLPHTNRVSLQVKRLAVAATPAFTRTKIQYLAEPGDFVDAHLLIPKNLKRKAPAMLCLHQTTKIGKDEPAGLGGSPQLHYGKELAERGYVCLVPDYPYLGENSFDPYRHGYLSCTMKGIVNHRRAIDVLASLPEVNAQRIGSIGHSLGGHNTLFVAAFDERIKAMVTSCGFTTFSKYYNGDLKGWAGVRYMPLIAEKYANDPAQVPFDFPEILIALAPRPLFINAPLHDSNFEVSGVRDSVIEARSVYEQVFRQAGNLAVHYPNAGHDFPSVIRTAAYSFLDRWLKH